MSDVENKKIDLAQKIEEQFDIAVIYGQLYRKDEGFYRILSDIHVRKIVIEMCKLFMPKDKITPHTIKDIIFYLSANNIIPERNINPTNRFSFMNGELLLDDGLVSLVPVQSVFTFQSDLSVDLDSPTEEIELFLSEVFASKQDQMQFLESLTVGMFPTLRHRVNFDSFVLCYGTGANGKSVLFEAIIKPIFGAGAIASIPIEAMNKRFFLANLLGRRINVATENSSNHIAENREVKALTSGDTQTVERKHAQPFEANMFCSLFFCINKEPSIGEISYAMKRRLRIINFPYRFSDMPKGNERKADPSLKDPKSEKTKRLQQGLIVLIKETAERLWHDQVMTPNDQAIISDLQNNSSHYRQFITDWIVFDESAVIISSELFKEYVSFCEQEHIAERVSNKVTRWTDPSPWDKASRTANHLTRVLCELYPDQISKDRNSTQRLIRGLKIKVKDSVIAVTDDLLHDDNDNKNELSFSMDKEVLP